MDIKKRDFLAAGLGLGAGLGASLAASGAAAQPAASTATRPAPRAATPRSVNSGVQPSSVDPNYKPRRLNKVIELWEDGQPMYYTSAGLTPGVDAYGQGVKLARTYADCIAVEFEHTAFDMVMLTEFMRGIVDGGPTRSGHRMPCVYVASPVIGMNEPYALANSWHIGQILDCGVMGVTICHARDPKAIEVFAHMAARYPFDYPNTPKLERRGLRGNPDGPLAAAGIWGLSFNQYIHVADLWPLNPRGELIFGTKIEDSYADANAEKTLAIPGIAFAEYGAGDHDMSINGLTNLPENGDRVADFEGQPDMMAARQRVLDICKKNNVKYLNYATPGPGVTNVLKQIKDGVMVLEGGEEAAIIGREFTKRKMPV